MDGMFIDGAAISHVAQPNKCPLLFIIWLFFFGIFEICTNIKSLLLYFFSNGNKCWMTIGMYAMTTTNADDGYKQSTKLWIENFNIKSSHRKEDDNDCQVCLCVFFFSVSINRIFVNGSVCGRFGIACHNATSKMIMDEFSVFLGLCTRILKKKTMQTHSYRNA